MAAELEPEDKRIISVRSGFVEAKDFYACVRGLQKRLMMIEMGIDEITPYDRFFITMARYFYFHGSFGNGGTANTPPDDVIQILNALFAKEKSNDTQGR